VIVQVSAVCFTADSRAFAFADKFGDVFGCRAHPTEGTVVHMLGHYCSIITALCVDSDNRCAAVSTSTGYMFLVTSQVRSARLWCCRRR
jgi:hypothetical protein